MQLKPGYTFAGRYELVKKIGRGGFSEVWKAKDHMAESHIVALKIYASDSGLDESGLKQFRREYSRLLSIQHSQLVKANYFDIYNERPYLVMPFMEGGSLHDLLVNSGSVDEKTLAVILTDVLEGLSYLHQKGIVHQDIKPDNVLIDEEGRYYLTDFGISQRFRATLQKSTQLGTSAMTLSYAAPERFHGHQKATPAGDIFSLGVMMYELLTGELPWMGAGGLVLNQYSPALKLPKNYSNDIGKIINACIVFNPEVRPSSNALLKGLKVYSERLEKRALNVIANQESRQTVKRHHDVQKKLNFQKDEELVTAQTDMNYPAKESKPYKSESKFNENQKYFGYRLAKRRERFFAFILHILLVVLPVLTLLDLGYSQLTDNPSYENLIWLLIVSLTISGAICYPLWSGTFGHAILGLKVISAKDGSNYFSAKRGALRELAKGFFFIFFIPVIWLLWDKDKRNFYDVAFNCYVVKTQSKKERS